MLKKLDRRTILTNLIAAVVGAILISAPGWFLDTRDTNVAQAKTLSEVKQSVEQIRLEFNTYEKLVDALPPANEIVRKSDLLPLKQSIDRIDRNVVLLTEHLLNRR